MYQDYKDLLSAFHAHGVKYLIVGGFAVILHAQPRFTKDIDLFIKPTRRMRTRPMLPLPHSVRRFKVSARSTSPTATVSFALDVTQTGSISFPIFRASILTRHGKAALGP